MKNKYIILLLVTQLFVLIISILFLVNIKQLVTQANSIKITDTQNAQILVDETQTNVPKGLIDNLDEYRKKSIKGTDIPFEFTNSIFTEGVKCSITHMSAMCTPSSVVLDNMYMGKITLLSKDISFMKDGDSTYYIANNGAGGPAFHGPFTGNVKNIFTEAFETGNLVETETYDSFLNL